MVVGRAELSSNAADNSSVGNTGFWSVPDEIELVCAPPVLCTTPVRGSGVAHESADNELWAVVDDVDEIVVNDGDSEPDGEFDADDELGERLDGPLWPVDEDAVEPGEPEDEELDDEPESDGSARATPGMVATAVPTPSATASAPTRPTYLT